jgi:16S rRNA (guanine966-N2)-methyltransferase
MLRVTGGRLKGRQIYQPDGIRPTSEKVREAIFNVLAEQIPDAKVLELFAGSGALGIEAYSRGAASVMLVESSSMVARTIGRSLEKLGIPEVRLSNISAERFLAGTVDQFDLVLLDPPYDYGVNSLTGLSRLLAEEGILVVEYSSRSAKPAWEDLDEITTKRYGDTAVGYYRRS